MSGSTAVPSSLPSVMAGRMRPVSAAEQRTLPVIDPLAPLLPTGLPRGVAVTTAGDAARSLAFVLAAGAGQAGSWLAVLGLEGPGWRAVAELGVATGRLVHVEVGADATRVAEGIAAALDGFDLVLVGPRIHLTAAVERRLHARARERGAVLIGVHEDFPAVRGHVRGGPFAAVADLRGTTRVESWQGPGAGTGHLSGRRVEIVMEGKRLPGRRRSARLWMPGSDGTVAPVAGSTAAPIGPARSPVGSTGDRSPLPIGQSA
jgi:hypothetical protein